MSVSYSVMLKPFVLDLPPAQAKEGQVIETATGSSEAEGQTHSAEKAEARNAWLISPIFDLLFVCGLAPWIFGYLIQFSSIAVNTPGWHGSNAAFNITLVIAALLIGESHQFTSIVRYLVVQHKDKEHPTFKKFIWGAVLLHIVALILFSTETSSDHSILRAFEDFGSGFLSLGLTFFPVVLMQHVCAQAKGIGLIYCARGGFQLTKHENILLSFLNFSLVLWGAFVVAAPFGVSGMPLSSEELLAPVQVGIFALAISSLLLFSVRVFIRGVKTGSWIPAPAAILWANLAAFILLSSWEAIVYVWFFVPIFFHATQHWAVAWMTSQKEAKREAGSKPGFKDYLLDFGRLVLPIQVITLAVLFLPLLGTSIDEFPTAGGFETLPLGWSMFVFYLHYFADRVVWRPKKGGKKNYAAAPA